MTLEYNNSLATGKPNFRISNHVELTHNNTDWSRGLCPVCSPTHKNKSKTLCVKQSGTDAGSYHCKRGCTSDEIREALGVPKREYQPHNLRSYTPATSVPPKKARQPKLYPENKIIQEHSELMSLKDSALNAIRYLANRLITTDLIQHYKLGLSRTNCNGNMLYSISVPIPYEDGYMIKKRVSPWDKKAQEIEDYKAWSQYGVIPTVYFSYQPKNASQTWLCEGEWDAMLLGWIARQNQADFAVASFTCGCGKVPPQSELDKLPGEVYIFYDRNDNLINGVRAGEVGAKNVAKQLGGRAKIASVPMPINCTVKGWDVTDAIKEGYTLESFERAALEAEPYKPFENTFSDKLKKVSDIYRDAPDYIDWLVPDLFTSNELFGIFAPPRAGKSLFCLGLAKAIASGTKFLDRPCQQGKVIYICKEDPDDKVKERVIAQGWTKEEMDNVLVQNDFTIDELPDLIAYVKYAKPALIIFDTLSRVQTSNNRENSAEIADVLAPLQKLAQDENVCIIVVHHTRKGNFDDVDVLDIFDTIRGSGAIRATCRGTAVIAKSKEGFRLAVENGRTATQDLKVHLNPADLTWRLNGFWHPPSVDKSQKDIVFDWFLKHREGTIEQIYQGTLIRKKYIYEILTRLISEKQVSRTGKRYNTRYYINPIPPIPQVESEWNELKLDTESNIAMDSTTLRYPPSTEKPIAKDTKLYESDRKNADREKKGNFVESSIANNEMPIITSDTSNNIHSTTGGFVESNSQIPIKADRVSVDRNCHTTNFFDKNRSQLSQAEEKEAEKSIVGLYHKKEGFYKYVSEKGSRIEVKQSGGVRFPNGKKTKWIYKSSVDRYVYEGDPDA